MCEADEVSKKDDSSWPIVYASAYNVRFCWLEKLHPFDASKWKNIFQDLTKHLNITKDDIVKPTEISAEELLLVHTKKYLRSLKCSWNVAAIAEIPFLVLVPNFFVQRFYLRPMRFQTKGTVTAGLLALERGWAINIGGGFHHCSRDRGGGFCPYADISLLVRHLFEFKSDRVKKVMIVDLDAHQGNGHERDFTNEDRVFIMDVYNKDIYPKDAAAKSAVRCKVELHSFTEDDEYLDVVERNLESSLQRFHPDLLVYNAGTDILNGDFLGRLSISPKGIIRRDEIVFIKANERRVPIVMLTSGGYLKETCHIIADSIINLYNLELIFK